MTLELLTFIIIIQLKLYAMHQKIQAPIDNTYTASAYSASTLKLWFTNNTVVGGIATSSQILFPVLVTIYVTLFFFFALELEPYNLGKKLRNELESKDSKVKAKADSKLLTKFIASSVFHIFTLAMDGAALFYYRRLSKDVQEYYCSDELKPFWGVPITMTIFDGITFFLFILLPPLIITCKKKSYLLIYTLISPLSCIASHSYHIVFAFIIDPYHATSILLLYAIIAFVNIQGFQKLFYFINTLISGDKCSCCHIKNSCGQYLVIVLCFVLEFTFMAISIALSIALIFKLPISNALDDAPNHLHIIYQASITFFAALIAFQILFKQSNSSFNVFIKAIDRYLVNSKRNSTSDQGIELQNHAEAGTKTWTELSETEKEMLLAKMVMSYLNQDIQFASSNEIKDVFKQRAQDSSSTQPRRRKWCACYKRKQETLLQEGTPTE